MIFTYKASNKFGATVSGELEASDKRDAVRRLKDKGLLVTVIEAEQSASVVKGKASRRDLALSLHEMATLLESGVSVSATIDAQSAASYPEDLHQKYVEMTDLIRKGETFSDALAGVNLGLPDYFLPLIRSGELTGELGLALREGVIQFEYDLKVSEEIRSALIYPCVLVASGITAVLLIFVFVVPKFAPMVSRADDLPLLSIVILSGGMWFNDNILLVLLILTSLVVGAVYGIKNEPIRLSIERFAFRLPVVGSWMHESDIATWSSLMSTLLNSRVELLSALDLARSAMRSELRRHHLSEVVSAIRAGDGLADSLERTRSLTPTGYNLIRSGEKTGRLPEMMKSVARLYEEAARTRMKRMMALIEPLAILVIGGVIGVIILGVILAMTSANELAV